MKGLGGTQLKNRIQSLIQAAEKLALENKIGILLMVNDQVFATPNVNQRLERSKLCCDLEGTWQESINKDTLDLGKNKIKENDLVKNRVSVIFPATIDLMKYEELISTLRQCIVRNHQQKGRKGNMIR